MGTGLGDSDHGRDPQLRSRFDADLRTFRLRRALAKEFRKAHQAGVSFYELRIRVTIRLLTWKARERFVLARCWPGRESGKCLSGRQTFFHNLAQNVEEKLVCFLDSGG
jgi:hypothetical protein